MDPQFARFYHLGDLLMGAPEGRAAMQALVDLCDEVGFHPGDVLAGAMGSTCTDVPTEFPLVGPEGMPQKMRTALDRVFRRPDLFLARAEEYWTSADGLLQSIREAHHLVRTGVFHI